MENKTKNFIKESILKHNNKYDYSKVEYVNARTKVTIICREHGEFGQVPNNHKRGNGCPKCLYNKKDKKQVINEFKNIHGNKYDYSKVEYINTNSKVIIICQIHGEFEQTPNNHKHGQGCGRCNGKNKKNSELINEFKNVHGNKYDYSKVEYVNTRTKVKIVCPIHGEFEQTPNNHLSGQCCGRCNGNSVKTNEILINEFKNVHGNKYDYSKVEYTNAHTKIIIICPTHGEFEQTPNNHKHGNGCPICNESKGEREIREYLINKNINFIPQYKFDDCKNVLSLPFDFYLPDYNICIEYNGIQHYKPVEHFGGENGLIIRQKNDKIKMEYCYNNDIPFLIINYNENVINKLSTLEL
jgi:hypothetical protein